MRRVVSVWFPHWPTDRLRRQGFAPKPDDAGLVTCVHDGRRRVIAAVDEAAAALGLRPGTALARALALVPKLAVADAEPEADAAALHRLALWCHRFTPLASVCAPDGIWLDIGGAAHLFGGESALLTRMLSGLHRHGLHARAAAADTPAAAHALARHGRAPLQVIAPGEQFAAVSGLPVACLRLPPELEPALRRLGFEQVHHLLRMPRPLLNRRFGQLPGLRLDQVRGVAHEPLVPLPPDRVLHRREAYLDPLLTAEALAVAIGRLVKPLCAAMERAGLGTRRLDLVFERIDHNWPTISIGTAQPSRTAGHLVRLLTERLDTIDPGLGIEAMQLVAPLVEPLRWAQQDSAAGPHEVAQLVDRLSNRLGTERVYRAMAMEAALPEYLVGRQLPVGAMSEPPDPIRSEPAPIATPPLQKRPVLMLASSTEAPVAAGPRPDDARFVMPGLMLVRSPDPASSPAAKPEPRIVPAWQRPRDPRPPTQGTSDRTWPDRLKPPARLLIPPHPVRAIASLPNGAPAGFTWRRQLRVRRSEGPERIQEAWWDGDHQGTLIRDYFQVEVEGGQRFWLFRRGNGLDLRTGNLSWFLHGLF